MIWFLNGKYLRAEEAKVSVADLAVLRGVGVFDFLVTYKYKPFLLEDHLDRLYHSAQLIDLKIPYSKNQLKKFVKKTIQKNHFPDLTVRIVVTGGISKSNIFPEGKSNVAILINKRVPYPSSCYTKGIKLKTYEYLRFKPEAKHIDYLAAAVIKAKAVKKGFLEVLYTWQGQVLECTTSNFYLIKNKTLITPKENILKGITRKVVLGLAKKFLKIKEKAIFLKDLKTADEALISASDKEIMPVVKIDNQQIKDGKRGKYTSLLIKAFRVYTQNFKNKF